MNIYLLSQDTNTDYDTFDSMVVYANTEEEARNMHPEQNSGYGWGSEWGSWAKIPEQVNIQYIGTNPSITEPSIILASFNAG